MTSEEFQSWLKAMQISAAKAAELLDVKPNTITRYKRDGAPQTVALACAALYHRLEEWK
jgi:transcriptional regulator with XRE-family HTH domain